MLIEGHIFTIKTKDPQNVADIKNVSTDVVISGLNVLKDQIAVGDLVFVVFGGDKPPWETGLVGLAQISRTPFDEGYDGKKNFRVGIDIVSFFEHITRGNLVSYPDTFDTIGIAPITKWEPNQAITSVPKEKAIALLQAICELRPNIKKDVEKLLGSEFAQLTVPVKRYIETLKPFCGIVNLREEFRAWLTNVYRKKDGSALGDTSSYVNCLSYLTDASQHLGKYDERSTSYWYNMYHFLYGEDGASVFECLTRKDVEERFKGVIAAVIDGDAPDGVDIAHFNIVREWSNEPQVKKGSWVKCSFARYFEFLEWREAQKKPEGKDDELLPTVDRLSVALKLFAEKRYEAEWQGCANKEGFLSIFDAASLKSADIAALTLDDFYKEFLLKVWAFTNGGSRRYGQLDDAAKAVYRDFVVRLKTSLESFDNYFPPNIKCPDGMGVGVLSELLMRFWPGSCCSYNKSLIHEGLVAVGMAEGDFVWPKTPSIYQEFMGKCAVILRKMEEMNLPRKPIPGNEESPDYITVNEFLWFASDNKDLIKEEVMSKQFKSVDSVKKVKRGTKKLSDFMNDDLLKRLAAALRTKPFAILAGHSGTGKSQLVRKLAYMTCADEGLMAEADKSNAPGNYCMVQVRPNWHDSTDLLGYYSEITQKYRTTPFVEFVCKAYAYPEIPFFVCLDEMNLAPVEQYFAEYLSAIESADFKNGVLLTDALLPKTYSADEVMSSDAARFTESKTWFETYGLTIPKNLFVVGTVNMDDTTCQFSRKVLDRAMTILMDKVDFASMQDPTKSAAPGKDDLMEVEDVKKFLDRKVRAGALVEEQVTLLKSVDAVLGKTPFAVAYRFANEYALYEDSLAALTGVAKDIALAKKAMDECVLMKVLPRIHGEDTYIRKLFQGDGAATGLNGVLGDDTLSGKKMKEILDRNTTYLSFWP